MASVCRRGGNDVDGPVVYGSKIDRLFQTNKVGNSLFHFV
jgi:hypothetical protein